MKETDSQASTYCANCKSILQGEFCHACGQKVMKERFSLKLLFGEFARKLLDVDAGLLFTIKVFFLRPGRACREYLQGAQVKYAKPVQFFFLTTALVFLVFGLSNSDELFVQGFEEGFSHGAGESGKQLSPELQKKIEKLFSWMKDIRLFIISSIPVYALVFKWLFKKAKFYYAEHFIFLLFITAQSNIIALPFFALGSFINSSIITIGSLLSILYTVWAAKQFYQSSWFRSLSAYLLSILLYFVLLAFVFVIVGILAVMVNPELFAK